MLKGQL